MTRIKQLKIRKWVFMCLHYICMLGPLVFFSIKGLIAAQDGYRVVLPMTISASILLACIGLMVDIKYKAGIFKTVMWTMVLAITYSLHQVKTFVWILAIASILDECFFRPIYYNTKQKLMVSKEFMRNNG